MANTYVDYVGNGSETDFNFSFPYIKTSHVAVEVNEGPAGGTNRWVRTSDFTVQTSPTTFVRFNSAPANLVRVRVLRDSDASTGIVDFANGSVLTETELDNAYEHNRYLAEEAEEGKTGGALVKNPDTGQFDADALRLENLADPDSDDDAVNKGYADTRFVNVTGDTMTGSLAMSNNNITGVNTVSGLATPTSDNHAANKKYVDDEVADEAAARVTNDALQVTKAGDSMSGNLTMTSPAKVIQNQAPTSGDDLTNKTYVDNATTTLTNNKVSKSGDTMTGALTLPNADPTNGNHATRKTYVDAQIAATLATGVAGGPIDTVNIENDAVTFAKMQDINSGNVIGRTTAGIGDPEEVPILDEDDMTSDSDTSLATQQSIKAYVDTAVSGVGGEDNVQADWNVTDDTSDAFILNKPSLATVATTGNYSDLSGTPTIPSSSDDLTEGTTNLFNQTHTGDVTGSTALTIASGAVTHDKISTTDSVFKINTSDQVRIGGDLNDAVLQAGSQFGITSSSGLVAATIETTASADAVLVVRAPGAAILSLRDSSTVGTNNGIYNFSSIDGKLQFGSIKDDGSARTILCNMFPKGSSSGGVFQIEPITVSELTAAETGFTPAAGMIAYVSNGDSGSPCLAVHDGSSFKRVALGTTISAT